MSERRAEEDRPAPWPPFRPNLKLRTEFEQARPKKELAAFLREIERRRKGEATETAPEKPT